MDAGFTLDSGVDLSIHAEGVECFICSAIGVHSSLGGELILGTKIGISELEYEPDL